MQHCNSSYSSCYHHGQKISHDRGKVLKTVGSCAAPCRFLSISSTPRANCPGTKLLKQWTNKLYNSTASQKVGWQGSVYLSTHIRTHSHTQTHTLSLSLSYTHMLALHLAPSLLLSLTHTHTHYLLSHTLPSPIHTLFLSLFYTNIRIFFSLSFLSLPLCLKPHVSACFDLFNDTGPLWMTQESLLC